MPERTDDYIDLTPHHRREQKLMDDLYYILDSSVTGLERASVNMCIDKVKKCLKERLSIVYLNGDTDTIKFTRRDSPLSGLFLHDNCIYTYRDDYHRPTEYDGAVICGVRSYRKL